MSAVEAIIIVIIIIIIKTNNKEIIFRTVDSLLSQVFLEDIHIQRVSEEVNKLGSQDLLFTYFSDYLQSKQALNSLFSLFLRGGVFKLSHQCENFVSRMYKKRIYQTKML